MTVNDDRSDARPAQRNAPVRVMRWTFVRGEERLTCELGLADDHACYELRTVGPGRRSVDRFVDVTAAFQRQSSLEGSLVREGWSLDSYESVVDQRSAGAA